MSNTTEKTPTFTERTAIIQKLTLRGSVYKRIDQIKVIIEHHLTTTEQIDEIENLLGTIVKKYD